MKSAEVQQATRPRPPLRWYLPPVSDYRELSVGVRRRSVCWYREVNVSAPRRPSTCEGIDGMAPFAYRSESCGIIQLFVSRIRCYKSAATSRRCDAIGGSFYDDVMAPAQNIAGYRLLVP